MNINISAEFTTMQEAEAAVRHLIHDMRGIRKILYRTERTAYKKVTELTAYPYAACIETFTLLPDACPATQSMQEVPAIEHPQTQQAVTVQILCDTAMSKAISSQLEAAGGSMLRLHS